MNITYEDAVALWQSFDIKNAKRLDAYLGSFSVLFAYHSGAIENPEITYHDTHEVFENGKVVNYTGSLRTLFEIRNMKDAYRLMCRWFDEKAPITESAVKQMHYELTKDTYDERRWHLGERPGEFKKQDIWGAGSHDVAAPVSDVKHDLEEDIREIANVKDKDALIAAAFFHARFEAIHAFADGNGRVGRAMMNYFLILHNHPPIVIYREDRKRYYNALDGFDVSGDLKPLSSFLKDQTIKTWKEAASRYTKTAQRDVSLETEAHDCKAASMAIEQENEISNSQEKTER